MKNSPSSLPEPKPIDALVNPPNIQEKEDAISDKQKNIDTEILTSMRDSRTQKQFLFTRTLCLCTILYGAAILFTIFSKQNGIDYFIGIMAFMTPATIILSLLISKIIEPNNKSSQKDDLPAISLVAKTVHEIVKAFKQPPNP